MKLINPTTLLALAGPALAEVMFSDNFDNNMDNWIQSKHKSDYGKFDLSAGAIYADEEDKGLHTSQDAKFYALSTKFNEFSNAEKTLVIQFSVKHAQKIDCGGGYVKVFPASFNPEELHGESEYNIMFGPDICGYSTKKVHVIFSYNGKNHLINKEIKCKDDEFTHVYSLVIKPTNEYEVYIDGESAQAGSLEEDWDMLEPKTIKDPEASKPKDWVDQAKIDDPEDKKPEGYDDIEEYIPDPEAEVPEDWDEEMDGEWEAPMINNPEFKGEWKAKQIDNPDYKGPWEHPMIDNPDYVKDEQIYSYESWGAIGLDLWQVKSGTVFDNFLITDDVDAAIAAAKATIEKNADGEKKMKEEADKAAAEAAAEEGEGDDEDEEDLDEDDFEEEDFDDEFDGHDEL